MFWLSRLTHPLPFLALTVLLVTSVWKPLNGPQGVVMGVYVFYLLPYIGASYYERYAFPLLVAKVLLVIWAADRLLSFSWFPDKGKEEQAGRLRLRADHAEVRRL